MLPQTLARETMLHLLLKYSVDSCGTAKDRREGQGARRTGRGTKDRWEYKHERTAAKDSREGSPRRTGTKDSHEGQPRRTAAKDRREGQT